MNKIIELINMKHEVDILIENKINNLDPREAKFLNENLFKMGYSGAKLAGTVFRAGKNKATNKVLTTGTKATRFVIDAIDDALKRKNNLLRVKNKEDMVKHAGDVKKEFIDSLKTGKQGVKNLPKNMKARPYTTLGVAGTLGAYGKIKHNQIKKKKEEQLKEILKNKTIIDKAKDKMKGFDI